MPPVDDIITLIQQLIEFPTMHSRPDQINRCADFITSFLTKHQIAFKRLDNQQIPSILVLPQDNHAPVILASHIDVVDAPEHLFKPYVKQGLLFGRGSIDDKYAVALSLILLKETLNAYRANGKDQSQLPFGILITGDEEIGSRLGAQFALKHFSTDFAIILDGGSVDKIVTRQKGVLRLNLIANGKAAHGSRPWLGENAIELLMKDYLKIKSHFGITSEDHWHRTLNIGTIFAGKSVNQVPDFAEAGLDIRFTEKESPEEIIAWLQKDVTGEIKFISQSPMYQAIKSPLLDVLLSIVDHTKTGFEHGASDARHFTSVGIPTIVWGADGDNSQHGLDEHLNIESLSRLYQILERFIGELPDQLQT